MYLREVAGSGTENLGYNNILTDQGSGNVAVLVPEETQVSKHWVI